MNLDRVTPGKNILDEMSVKRDDIDWQCLTDADAVATRATELILQAAASAVHKRGIFKLVLAGGRTPEKVYRHLANEQADWNNWQLYFGDERCLPSDHPDRNSQMAARSWLAQGQVPADHIHPIPAELGPATAAQQYAGLLSQTQPFDMVMLGIGEDGHTASLFPGQSFPSGEPVHAVHGAPKPPAERVSLSAASLSDSREILVLVTGRGKREAVRQWQQGTDLPKLPASRHGIASLCCWIRQLRKLEKLYYEIAYTRAPGNRKTTTGFVMHSIYMMVHKQVIFLCN